MAKNPAAAVPLDQEPDATFLPVGRANPEPAPRDLAELVARTWAAKLRADTAVKALENLKADLKRALVPGDSITLKGLCKVTLTPRETWSVANPDRLEKVLGASRFRDLVDVQTTYKPTVKLVHLQDDPAEDQREAIAACLVANIITALDMRENKA